jgi:hypothetical protein
VTAIILSPAPASSDTRTCRWCRLPITLCPVLAEGNLTYCGGWVHVPPAGRRFGRHSCGTTRGASTQAAPEGPRKESNA